MCSAACSSVDRTAYCNDILLLQTENPERLLHNITVRAFYTMTQVRQHWTVAI